MSGEVLCSNCQRALEDTTPRVPCPVCGSLARAHPAGARFAISAGLTVDSVTIHRLDTASKYYSEILKPTHDEFFASLATLRSAFTLATYLFHFRDWLHKTNSPQLQSHFGKKLGSVAAFWEEVEKLDSRFGYIRDVANASKHVTLEQRPSTSMTHVANTFIETSDTARVKMQDAGSNVDFDDCAKALFEYWTNLSQKIGII
jgi:hypothetical protein